MRRGYAQRAERCNVRSLFFPSNYAPRCVPFLCLLLISDVVKTRLQAQINSITPAVAASCGRPTASQALLDNCSHYRLHTGLSDDWCANCFSYNKGTARPVEELRFTGAMDAASKLVRHEGVLSLWRGLRPTLLMSIPSTVVYFSVYDKSKIAVASLTPEYVATYAPLLAPFTSTIQSLSPLLSGVFARALTTTLVSPIELVRTKSQALRTDSTMTHLLREEIARGGPLSLWRGVGPTLMRDVPFSAIYWTTYEYSKLWMLVRWGVQMDKSVVERASNGAGGSTAHQNPHALIYASFLAGASSGMLSAAITHPFDLIKTRRQIELYALAHPAPATPVLVPAAVAPVTADACYSAAGAAHSAACRTYAAAGASTPVTAVVAVPSSSPSPSSTFQLLRTVIAEEGYGGLLSGLSARITKIAPACAIMISSYEVAKMYFGGHALTTKPNRDHHRHQHVE